MVAPVDRAMDNDTPSEADGLMHSLRLGKRRAFDRRVRWILPRRKLRRVLINMKLAITTSRWWRRHRHPRLSVPFVEFISGLRHVISSVLGIQSTSFLSPNLTFWPFSTVWTFVKWVDCRR